VNTVKVGKGGGIPHGGEVMTKGFLRQELGEEGDLLYLGDGRDRKNKRGEKIDDQHKGGGKS